MSKPTVVVLVDSGSTEAHAVLDRADVIVVNTEAILSETQAQTLLDKLGQLQFFGPFADRVNAAINDRIDELDEEEAEEEEEDEYEDEDEDENEDAEDFLDDELDDEDDEDEVYDPEDEEALEDAERS